MPSPASLSAYSLVSMEMPALDTQYSPRLTEETSAEQEEIFTITPRVCDAQGVAIMWRATSWVMNMLPLVLVPTTRSKLSSVISSRSRRSLGATPALLTSTPIRPCRAMASQTTRFLSCELAMSPACQL